jgi:hypothetical protein
MTYSTPSRMTEATEESKRRQIRRLKSALREELLGDSEPTPSDLSLIRRATLAELALRDLEERYAAGEPINPTDLVRIGNMHDRTVRAFRSGRKATKPAKAMTFQQRMAARNAKWANAEDDDDDETI